MVKLGKFCWLVNSCPWLAGYMHINSIIWGFIKSWIFKKCFCFNQNSTYKVSTSIIYSESCLLWHALGDNKFLSEYTLRQNKQCWKKQWKYEIEHENMDQNACETDCTDYTVFTIHSNTLSIGMMIGLLVLLIILL